MCLNLTPVVPTEIEEGEEELYSTGLGDEELEAAASGSGSSGASSSSSNGSGWGWGRSKEAETVYAGSNGSSSNGSGGSNGATFERFGFRLSGNTFDQPQQTGWVGLVPVYVNVCVVSPQSSYVVVCRMSYVRHAVRMCVLVEDTRGCLLTLDAAMAVCSSQVRIWAQQRQSIKQQRAGGLADTPGQPIA